MTFFVLLVVLSCIAAGAAYYIVTLPEDTMERERRKLQEVSNAILILRAQLNQIDSLELKEQQELIARRKTEMDQAYQQLPELELLPEVSDDIKTALDAIVSLSDLFQSKWITYEQMVSQVTAYSERIFPAQYSEKSIRFTDFYTVKEIQDHPDIGEAHAYINQLMSELYLMDLNLDSAILVIEQQTKTIDREIIKVRRRAYTLVFSFSGAIILLSVFAALIFARRMARAIMSIEQAIREMSRGDLTVRPNIRSRDELGQLCGHLLNFTETLSASVQVIKQSSGENVQVKDDLLKATDDASAQIDDIRSGSMSIRDHSDHLENQIDISASQIRSTVEYIQSVEEKLQEQTSMVEESTSAVTEMIASMNSVADITARKKEATVKLFTSAIEGGEKLAITLGVVQDIHGNIDEVMNTVSIIQNVTSQTNLLAMNAAIEAAHAGDAGRGFAVVAEEIRKLAETTAVSSKKISGVVKEVVSRIETAAESGQQTRNAFEAINSEITGVSNSLEEIAASMSQLQTGSSQVLEAMQNLQEVSLDIKAKSSEMTDASGKTAAAMELIKTISTSVRDSIVQIQTGAKGIGDAVHRTHSLAERISRVTENLDRESSRFQTEMGKFSPPPEEATTHPDRGKEISPGDEELTGPVRSPLGPEDFETGITEQK